MKHAEESRISGSYILQLSTVGEVFGISDSLNFHGRSVDELEDMFRQSIDNYLALCDKIGKEPDREFKGSFNVRMSPEMHRKAALAAKQRKMTLNQYVIRAISRSVETDNANTASYPTASGTQGIILGLRQHWRR